MRPYLDRVARTVGIDSNPPTNAISRAFMRAGEQMGLGRIDYRREIAEGVGLFPLNVIGDRRQAASQAYLHPLKALPDHFKVRCDTRAHRLILEGDRVVGCATNHGDILARKEVILACGSIQTPHLLMLSGIGPDAELAAQGITSLIDVQGVGMNLMDHTAANVCHELNDPMPPWNLTPCEAVLMMNGGDGSGCPELLFHFVLRMREKYVDNTEGFADINGVKISPNVTRPLSRGRLRLRSPDIEAQPGIELNYFSDPDGYDMRTLIHGLRQARKLAETRAFRGISAGEVLPGRAVDTDAQLEDYIRRTCETVYHPAGTCRMGDPSDETSVVDPKLRVKGVSNLRVCDASVFPSMVTVNINNAVMMVAEKAAATIIEACAQPSSQARS